MNEASDRQSYLGLKLFLVVVGIALGGLMILLAIDLSTSSLTFSELVAGMSRDGMFDALSSLAEVLAAVLGLSLTVVAIVVQLASQRYSRLMVDLFMQDKTNLFAFGFMVSSCIYVVILPIFASGTSIPTIAVATGLLLVVANFGFLLPYFTHVFSFLQPDNIITQIELEAIRNLKAAATNSDKLSVSQFNVTNAIESIADNCVAALQHSDRILAIHTVTTLERFLIRYLEFKPNLSYDWLKVPHEYFLSLSEAFHAEIIAQGLWLEAKILLEFEHLFRRSLSGMNELVSQLALSTRLIGIQAIKTENESLLRLIIQFFNTYIRHALNARNVRAVYNVLYQYRHLSASLISKYPNIYRRIVDYLVYYGRTANTMGLPFVTVTTAHDVRVMCEKAYSTPDVEVLPLLELFLSLDEDPEGKTEELALIGVRTAQSILGAFFLAKGELALADRIRQDMQAETSERLIRTREGILQVEERKFWEITDRGFNFDYVEPNLRPHVREFFQPLLERDLGNRSSEFGLTFRLNQSKGKL